MDPVAVVLVHGLFSSARTWTAMRALLRADPGLAAIETIDFEYPSPKLRLDPLRRIPDFDTLAESLQTFLRTLPHRRVILVTHSQGGLVAQRYLARMVMHANGLELERIRLVVMFACPNSGSEIFSALRRAARPLWFHPQERQLRPLDAAVAETHRIVVNRIIHAPSASAHEYPIPVRAYAGEEDNVVPPASARGVFPDTGVLPGDHSTIIRPDSAEHRTYRALRADIETVLRANPAPEVSRDQLNDYLYISARKVGRIGQAIRPEVWASMQTESDSDRRAFASAAEVIALVPQVEERLDEEYGLRELDDPDLRTGQWFRIRETPMLYGIPADAVGGVIFLGQTDATRFALGGSAEFLLDRPAEHLTGGPWGYSASGLMGILDLLGILVPLDSQDSGGSDDGTQRLDRLARFLSRVAVLFDRDFETVSRGLGPVGEPLNTVARCLHTGVTDSGHRIVIATPLYVEFAVPK
ncbi:SAVMC3_10250 family protein [Nocardia takedensis]